MKLTRRAVIGAFLVGFALPAFGQEQQPKRPSEPAAQMVWVTGGGKKYHIYRDCRAIAVYDAHQIKLSEVGERKLCGFCRQRAAQGTAR